MESGLTTYMNVGIAPEGYSSHVPLKTILTWGEYRESVLLGGQGRILLPPIPLTTILDENLETIISDLELTIETI